MVLREEVATFFEAAPNFSVVTGSHNGESRGETKKQNSRGQVPPPPRRPRPLPNCSQEQRRSRLPSRARQSLSPGDAAGTETVSQERPVLRAPQSPPEAARPRLRVPPTLERALRD